MSWQKDADNLNQQKAKASSIRRLPAAPEKHYRDNSLEPGPGAGCSCRP